MRLTTKHMIGHIFSNLDLSTAAPSVCQTMETWLPVFGRKQNIAPSLISVINPFSCELFALTFQYLHGALINYSK